ncbi:MAG: gamma-glutamyl-gamma-aminobutyrate hydrolase family protein [Ruminococcaceae bacterium]|nr:gamma-glutamyl-gamma-aminobutyrate hydrolase family protein [Oscillospiraceae bacterium]
MILATILRTRIDDSMKPWENQFYICDHYKKIFDELGIVLFPILNANSAEEAVRVCDGLVLPGSDKNIYPEYYGAERNPEAVYKNDEYSSDKPVVDAFVKAGKPIVGICGGLQVLNVYFGGTLHQKVQNHDNVRHEIDVEKGSFLYEVYGRARVEVNSWHGQAVDVVAPGFKVTAGCADGTIEAIEKGNIVAVQWHPEVDLEIEFFERFVKKFF